MSDLIGVPWCLAEDGQELQPRMIRLVGGEPTDPRAPGVDAIEWYRLVRTISDDGTSKGALQSMMITDLGGRPTGRLGYPVTSRSEHNQRLGFLILTVTYFAADGSNPDPTPEGPGDWGKIRRIRIPMTTRQGIPYTDEMVAEAIRRGIEQWAQDVERDCAERSAVRQDRRGRAALIDAGLIDDPAARPNIDLHDQRRRVADMLPAAIGEERR